MGNFRNIVAVAFGLLAVPASAVTVHTSQFIFGGTNHTGFEGLGPVAAADMVTSYSEDGIHVDYVGSGFVWSTLTPAPEGDFSWFVDRGRGYTRIRFDDAQGIQFLVNSAWFDAGPTLAYRLFHDGSMIADGFIEDHVSMWEGEWKYAGFSDVTFDEIHIQVLRNSGVFDAVADEAGIYDAIRLTRVVETPGGVPEPAQWALMIAGFGLVGGAMRRREKLAC